MEKKRDETSSSSTISSKKLLKDLIHKKIAYYLSKAYLKDTDIYNVFKEFFSELLELKYEFTCGELLNELNKVFLDKSVRAKTVHFIDKISLIEYKQNAYSNEDIRKLFNEFDGLVNLLISKTLDEQKKGIFSFLFHKAKNEAHHPFFQKITDTQSQATDMLRANTQSANTTSSIPTEKNENNKDKLSDIISGELSVNNLNSKEEKKVSSNDVDIAEFNHEPDLVSDLKRTKSAIHTMDVNEDFTKEPIKKPESEISKKNETNKNADPKDINTILNKTKKTKSTNKQKNDFTKEPIKKTKSKVNKQNKTNKKTNTKNTNTPLNKTKKTKSKVTKTKKKADPKDINTPLNKTKKTKSKTKKKADPKDINTLLNKAKKIKSKNKLKEIYSKALYAYNALDNKNKSKYFSKLNNLYKKIV